MTSIRTKTEIPEGGGVLTVARIKKADGSYLRQSDIDTGSGTDEITMEVFDMSRADSRQPISTSTTAYDATAASTPNVPLIFDSLQTDDFGSSLGGTAGYNFRHMYAESFDSAKSPEAVFAKPGRYLIRYTWTANAGTTAFGKFTLLNYVSVSGVGSTG